MTEKREKKNMSAAHAVALFSGGLDSILAILLLRRQEIRITALTFVHDFTAETDDNLALGKSGADLAERFGFEIELINPGRPFIDLVKNPPRGYGKNMNPCLDCRIMMLREARRRMEQLGADFVATGEVLGQRPMSQYRPSLNQVEKESGLRGLLIRPLSAKLMPETIPEQNGLVDREMLESISGRSRKRQMEMAADFGLETYPNPASGCLLTDPSYSRRLKDFLEHNSDIEINDINLLKVGRHFRLSPGVKVIVGRNEQDNDRICELAGPEHILLEVLHTGSPVTLYAGPVDDTLIARAAALTARYCDLKDHDRVEVTCVSGGSGKTYRVAPARPDEYRDEIIT